MQSNKHPSVLRCPECGSRVFEIHGPVTDDAVLQCAECGFECGRLPEVMPLLEAKVREQDEDRRKRSFN